MGTGPEYELFFPHRKCDTNFPNPNFKSSPCPHLEFREHSLSSLLIFQNRPSSSAWGFVGLFRPFQTPPASQFQRPEPCTIMFSRSYNPTSLVPVLWIGYLWAPWQNAWHNQPKGLSFILFYLLSIIISCIPVQLQTLREVKCDPEL